MVWWFPSWNVCGCLVLGRPVRRYCAGKKSSSSNVTSITSSGVMNLPLNTVSVVSMIATAVMALVSYLLAGRTGKKVSQGDKYVLFWLWWDAMIHFTLEGAFIYFSLTGTVQDSNHFMSLLWKEYGKADKRWLVSDPTVVSLELLTVFIDGPLCLLLIYAIGTNKFYRHWVQLVLCVCELYGGWMTFCPEWLTGSPALVTDNPLYLWVYLVFFNGLWVVVPLALMYQSWEAMRDMVPQPRTQKSAARAKNTKKVH